MTTLAFDAVFRVETIDVILGPCRCQGCGELVLWVRHGRKRGWLHEDGRMKCRRTSKGSGPRPGHLAGRLRDALGRLV